MPRSFLVRLKPSMDNVIEKQNKTNSQASPEIRYNLPQASPRESDHPFIGVPGNLNQSHPDITRCLRNSQSSSSIVVTSHLDNQSAFDAVPRHHPVGAAFEIVIPTPQYHMPYHLGWGQHGWLPSNNHTWYSPITTSSVNNIHLRGPWKAQGELLHSDDKSSDRARQKASEPSKFPASFKEFFPNDQPTQTHPREGGNTTTKLATEQQNTPRFSAPFDKRAEERIPATTNEIPEEEKSRNGNLPQKNEPSSLIAQSEENNKSNTISRELPIPHTVDDKSQATDKYPEKLHSCQQCKKTFNRASNLRAHMKTHSDYKPYKCDFCGKGFHQKIDKRIHHYTHTGEKPHKCKKCGRGFKQLTHLNYHMRTHSDTHMYHCTYCGKGFNQKGNLQSHIYGHTGQRPFKCHICNKGFTLRSTLNTHLRTHAPKKPFICEHCNKAFYQKNALKMHHIASHPIMNGKSIL